MRAALLFEPRDWRVGFYWSKWARCLYCCLLPLQLRLDFERRAVK